MVALPMCIRRSRWIWDLRITTAARVTTTGPATTAGPVGATTTEVLGTAGTDPIFVRNEKGRFGALFLSTVLSRC
jgi:hypothetical protein